MSWICITSLRYHYGSVLLFHILIDSLICIIRGGKKNNYFGERKEGRGVCALDYWVSEKRCREWTRSFVSSEKLSEKPAILNIIPALYNIKLPVLSQTFFWLYRCLVNLNKKNCYKNQNWKWPILPYYHYHHHIVKLILVESNLMLGLMLCSNSGQSFIIPIWKPRINFSQCFAIILYLFKCNFAFMNYLLIKVALFHYKICISP